MTEQVTPATDDEIEGIYSAHIQLVHKDVDPSNCMVCAMVSRIESDRAKIAALKDENDHLRSRVTGLMMALDSRGCK